MITKLSDPVRPLFCLPPQPVDLENSPHQRQPRDLCSLTPEAPGGYHAGLCWRRRQTAASACPKVHDSDGPTKALIFDFRASRLTAQRSNKWNETNFAVSRRLARRLRSLWTRCLCGGRAAVQPGRGCIYGVCSRLVSPSRPRMHHLFVCNDSSMKRLSSGSGFHRPFAWAERHNCDMG